MQVVYKCKTYNMSNKMVHMVAFILLIVGGLNWLLVGLFNGLNVVELVLGTGVLAKAVYVLVGLSALYELVTHKSHCTVCSS